MKSSEADDSLKTDVVDLEELVESLSSDELETINSSGDNSAVC